MVMPDTKNPNQRIYMVRIRMSSQNETEYTERIDAYTRKQKFKRHEDIRAEIAAIRQFVNIRREFLVTPFYGAYFTNETGKEKLTAICIEADRKMKEIDPALYVGIQFVKQNFSDSENIGAFDDLIKAIRTEILDRTLKAISAEIEKNKNHLTEKTRIALNKMLDQCKPFNLTGDPAIDAEMEQMRARINANQLKELRDEILVIRDSLKDRGSALELVDDIRIKKPADPAPVQKPIAPNMSGSRVLDIL